MTLTRGLFLLCLLPSLASAQALQPVQLLHRFTQPTFRPIGALVQVTDGSFYGVTEDAIYRVAAGGAVTVVARLSEGLHVSGPLVQGPDGALYGTTRRGGADGWGTVFRFDPATGVVRTLHAFTEYAGADPFGGLVVSGGQLYGVASEAAFGGHGRAIIFRTDPATGATTNVYVFPPPPPAPIFNPAFIPSSPLTAGPDGRLYGTTRTPFVGAALYRFDPATGSVTFVHEFGASGYPNGRLHRGTDGRLYGVAFNVVYRFDVTTDTFEALHQVAGSSGPGDLPGPVVLTADGSLFGVIELLHGNAFERVIFRLRPGPGGYTFEEAHTLYRVDGNTLERDELTIGADGLVYGYTQTGGAAEAGTVVRFDPASDPLQVSVLHTFLEPTTWAPSAPTPFTDGALYGLTFRGGDNRRGAAYRLLPASGAVEQLSEPPDPMPERGFAFTTPLADGGDGFLYGYSSVRTRNGGSVDLRILRVNPSTGAVTIAFQTPTVGWGGSGPSVGQRMTRAADGNLYFLDYSHVMRFDPAANTLAIGGDVPGGGYERTALLAANDGQLYFGLSHLEFIPGTALYRRASRLMRVNRTTNTVEVVLVLGPASSPTDLVQGTDALYLGSAGSVLRIEPAAATSREVCRMPLSPYYLTSLTAVPDGRLVGIATQNDGTQRLAVCTPSTASIELRVLPPGIGRLTASLVASGGWLYGATLDQAAPLQPTSISRLSVPDLAQPGGALVRLSLDGAPPAVDTDGDGLSNTWETAFGLDPFATSGANGAAGDADGDGRTNAQELADGTHPNGTVTRYFAEGATGVFFGTRLDLANPNRGAPATVLLRFLTDTGTRSAHTVVVEAGAHASIDPATLPGLAHATFSTVVEADAEIGVARTMTWDPSGYGSHVDSGVATPSTAWYFAEGSTSGPFAVFYLLQNPNPTAVTATIRYLRPLGLPPVEKTYALPPFSRTTIGVDGEGPELESTDVSAIVTAPEPIVAERASYYSPAGQLFGAGHESAGVTAPALEWFLAEGATGTFFDLFVLVANPNDTAATVEVEYLLVGGGSLTKTYTVDPQARFTIYVDDEQLPAGSGIRPLAHTALSMVVRSTNAVPIVVERTMWWPDPASSADYWYEAHNTPGVTTTATRWVVPGVEIGGAAGAQAYILIGNPGATAGSVRITELTGSGTDPFTVVQVPAKSRTSIAVEAPMPAGRQGFLIESVGAPAVPVMVEYATYSSPGGVLWAAGGNALAVPLP